MSTLEILRYSLTQDLPRVNWSAADLLLRSTLILILVIASHRLLRRRSAACKHFAGLVGLGALLLLPLAMSLMPPSLGLLPSIAPPSLALMGAEEPPQSVLARPSSQWPTPEEAAAIWRESSWEAQSPTEESMPAAEQATPTQSWPEAQSWPETEAAMPWVAGPETADRTLPIVPALLALWALGSCWLLLRLSRGQAFLRGAFARAQPNRRLTGAMRRTARLRLAGLRRLTRAPEVRVSPEVDVPLAFGVLRPRILLPTEAQQWPAERVKMVLLHESAHLRRLDPATQLISLAACCLYWFHPLTWVAVRHLALDRELACDDLVLRAGNDARRYAEQLLRIAEGLRGKQQPSVAVSMARPSQLGSRLQALLDRSADRGHLHLRDAGLVLVGAVLLLSPLGAIRALGDPVQLWVQGVGGGPVQFSIDADRSGVEVLGPSERRGETLLATAPVQLRVGAEVSELVLRSLEGQTELRATRQQEQARGPGHSSLGSSGHGHGNSYGSHRADTGSCGKGTEIRMLRTDGQAPVFTSSTHRSGHQGRQLWNRGSGHRGHGHTATSHRSGHDREKIGHLSYRHAGRTHQGQGHQNRGNPSQAPSSHRGYRPGSGHGR